MTLTGRRRTLTLAAGVLVLLGGLALGAYWVLGVLIVAEGWGSIAGEELEFALFGVGALVVVAAGVAIIRHARRG